MKLEQQLDQIEVQIEKMEELIAKAEELGLGVEVNYLQEKLEDLYYEQDLIHDQIDESFAEAMANR